MTVTLEIPSDIAGSLPLPPDQIEAELKKELALALYARGALTSHQVCAWLGLTRWEGEELLAQRQVPRPYTTAELADELRHAGHGQ
jgi:predicted HTH domain antitoxin